MQSCRKVLPISTASINCKQVFARKNKVHICVEMPQLPKPTNQGSRNVYGLFQKLIKHGVFIKTTEQRIVVLL